MRAYLVAVVMAVAGCGMLADEEREQLDVTLEITAPGSAPSAGSIACSALITNQGPAHTGLVRIIWKTQETQYDTPTGYYDSLVAAVADDLGPGESVIATWSPLQLESGPGVYVRAILYLNNDRVEDTDGHSNVAWQFVAME